MAQTEYRMLVRPCKVAVLIPREADVEQVRAAIRFLSWLWGGRFGWIIPVSLDGRDERDVTWLGLHRPDIVYLSGLPQEVWEPLAATVCQPLHTASLAAHAVPEPFTPFPDNLITCAPVLELLYREVALRRRPSFYHVSPKDGHPLRPFVEAVFGYFDANWLGTAGPPKREPLRWLELEEGVPAFIEACTYASDRAFWGWLDVGSDGLHVGLSLGGEPPPTIVVVATGDDLALYWNIRSAQDGISWVLPIPVDSVNDRSVHRQIESWLEAVISRTGKRPNSCQVVSLTVERRVLDALAGALRRPVARLGLEYVDVHAAFEVLSRVTPRAQECTQAVDVHRRDVTMAVPKPDVARALKERGKWAVELTRDVRTRLAPGGVVLPRRACLLDVLNVPAPPTLPSTNPPRLGMAETGITLRVSNRDEIAQFRLPSDEEVLLEVLREGGIQPKADEKREAYRAAIDAFGGLNETARSSRGRLRAILRAFEQATQLTLSEIKEKAKLGNAKLPELLRPQAGNEFCKGISDVARRVSRQRFEAVWRETNPDNNRLQSLLDHWEDRGILRRCWQLKCQNAKCGRISWEDNRDRYRLIQCAKCGESSCLDADSVCAYALADPIRHAISEGIMPVVLAGTVLRKLSSEGFLWLPGVKYDRKGVLADIDVLACCDGYLILLECKDLEDKGSGEGTWKQLLEQFIELVLAARQVKADIVGVAALVDSFPDWWLKAARRAANGLGLLLLNKEALEEGGWPVNAADKQQVKSVSHLVSVSPRSSLVYDPPGERFIESPGLLRFTYGG